MAGKRIIVIGGGITGLAATYRLLELVQRPPVEVTLLEASDRVGGAIRTIRRDGFLIEAGPDNFVTQKPWALTLAKKLGLNDQLLETRQTHRRAMVVRRGKLLPVPVGFRLMGASHMWPIITSPLFSWSGKLRIAAEPFIPAHRGHTDESLKHFVTRRFGRQMLERLVQPLVGGIYTADPDSLSLRATLPQFLDMESQYGSVWRGMRQQPLQGHQHDGGARYSLFVTFKGGMQTLTDTLSRRIGPAHLRLNTPVEHLRRDPSRQQWQVRLRDDSVLTADGVVVAVPSYRAASMLEDLDRPLARQLSAIKYASSAVVNFVYLRQDVTHRLDAFGFVVPANEHRRILAGTFTSTKYEGRTPDSHVLIRVFLGGALQRQVLDLDDDRLIQTAQDDLSQLLGIRQPPQLAMLHRWPRSMPQYTVGHLDRVDAIEAMTKRLIGLELAGNAYHGVGIPDCIHAGEQASERVLKRWSANACIG